MSIVRRRRRGARGRAGGRAARRRGRTRARRNGTFTPPARSVSISSTPAGSGRSQLPHTTVTSTPCPARPRDLLPAPSCRCPVVPRRVGNEYRTCISGVRRPGGRRPRSAARWPRRVAGRARAASACVASSSATPSASTRARRRGRSACGRSRRGCARRSRCVSPAPDDAPPTWRTSAAGLEADACGPPATGAGRGRCPRSRGRSPRRSPPTASNASRRTSMQAPGQPLGRAGALVDGGVADQLVGPGRARQQPVQEERLREGRAQAREAAQAAGERAVVVEDPRADERRVRVGRRARRRASSSGAASIRASGLRKSRYGALPRAAPRLQP